MKFVLVGPAHPFRGGISQYNTSLCEALRAEHQVLLISFSRQYPSFLFPGSAQTDKSGEVFTAQGERLLDSMGPLSWRRAARRIRTFQPHAVIFQWWQPFFGPSYSGIIKRLKREIAVFFLCHNVYAHERIGLPGAKRLERWVIARTFRQVDGFLVHSAKLAEQVRRFNATAPIRRIYHPCYSFYSRWDGRATAGSSKHRLLFFGKIRQYKGLDVFLKALRLVGDRLDYRATIAGEFYVDPEPYRQMAGKWGLAGRLTWHDRYVRNEEVPRLFQQADLVVVPYRRATQSGVVPLAYEFDVPVVASDVGGLSEVVLDQKTGYLFPAGDARALAERITEYFRDGKKEQFQRHIRCFKQNLSWDQVVDNILALLQASQEARKR
ncbi:MAG: glycosyltransferase [Acidobacteriota bacterium]